jgi:hypothetical protein
MRRSPLIISFIAALLYISCTEEACNCSDPGNLQFYVSFRGEVPFTKAPVPFDQGVVVSVFGYRHKENPLVNPSWPGTPFVAISGSYGQLLPAAQEEFLVPGGVYDFYAISENSPVNDSPVIEKGLSAPLYNGKDYLYAKQTGVTVKENLLVPLVFNHICATIELIVSTEPPSLIHEISGVSMTPPKEGSSLLLSTGKITPANNATEGFLPMEYVKEKAKMIILPTTDQLEIKIRIVLGKTKNSSGSYKEGIIPTPKGGYSSGKRYIYMISLSYDNIRFTGSFIEDWKHEALNNIEVK